jgi:hypothetical integral membrane protein (TIGR02206 family)
MAFVLFGSAHLTALALSVGVPLLLAALVRARAAFDAPFRIALAALLGGGWLGFYAVFGLRGWLTIGNALPLNLCDWATAVLLFALLRPSLRAYELGYFWGLGGTLQGLLTPDITRGFPDPQFLFFFIGHGGVLAALLYLTLGTGLRPLPRSLPRVAALSLGYMAVAALVDWALGTNYGFLRAKPANISLMSALPPWPFYIPDLVLIGLASLLVYYAPFGIADAWRSYRAQSRRRPSAST